MFPGTEASSFVGVRRNGCGTSLILRLVLAASLAVPLPGASAATVRLPTSAADWATFSPQQQSAAYDWVWAQYRRLILRRA